MVKIAIYGNGNMGKYVIEQLKSSHSYKIMAVIDKNKSFVEDIPVFNVEEFLNSEQKVDYVIITALSHIEKYEMAEALNDKTGDCKLHFQIAFANECIWYYKELIDIENFIEKNCEVIDISSTYKYVEMHVQDDCNLNCKGCSHYSPLFEKGSVVDLIDFEKDVKSLKGIFKTIVRFRLLGGEPFLNQSLDKYIEVVRKYYPNTDLRICTNGLLYNTVQNNIIQSIIDNKVIIDVSMYKPTSMIIDKIIDFFEKRGIPCVCNTKEVIEEFNTSFAERIGKKEYTYRCVCGDNGICTNVYRGKASRCPTAMYLFKFNEYFGLNFPEDGLIDMNNHYTPQEFKHEIEKNFSLCKHCISFSTTWKSYADKKPNLSDWVADMKSDESC